jgi:hypothetical protein
MTARDQLGSKFAVVVNLAVANELNLAVFTAEGLLATLDVNNCQPLHRQAHWTAQDGACRVRPAMDQGLLHSFECHRVDPLVRIERKRPANAAHRFVSHLDRLRASEGRTNHH